MFYKKIFLCGNSYDICRILRVSCAKNSKKQKNLTGILQGKRTAESRLCTG